MSDTLSLVLVNSEVAEEMDPAMESVEVAEYHVGLLVENEMTDGGEMGVEEESVSQLGDQIMQHSKPFTCQECNKGFTRKGDMARHYRKHTGEKPFNCPECNDQFTRKDDMVRHLRAHRGIKPHECPVCKQKFGRKPDMLKHLLSHAGIKACGCPTCGCPFSHKGIGNRKTCAFTAPPKKVFCCPACDETYMRKKDLSAHYSQTHTQQETVAESVPNQTDIVALDHNMCSSAADPLRSSNTEEVQDNSNSSQQVQEEEEDKPMTLEEAQRRIPRSVLLKLASSIKDPVVNTKRRPKANPNSATGQKKCFGCPQCGDVFSRKADMTRHLLLHSGVKPFQCPDCPRNFSRRDDQARHTLTHSKVKPYQCKNCDKGFIRKSEFAAHMLNHSKN